MPVIADLIRHAESSMNVDMMDPTRVPFIGGRQNEVDLSNNGEIESTGLGHYALREHIRPTRFYSSPATRTMRTHELSSRAMGLTVEPVVDARLQELDQGEWTNQPRSLYEVPANKKIMRKLGSDFAPPGGESMNMVGARVEDFMRPFLALSDTEPPEHIWVHTHGVAIKTFIRNLMGWTHQETHRTPIHNASLTRVIGEHGLWRVAFFDRRTH